LVKQVKKIGEETKIALRNIRREGNETLKSLEKTKKIAEDDLRRGQEQVQKITDGSTVKVDEILQAKEHELMEV
jgi:ribosome recycling factor